MRVAAFKAFYAGDDPVFACPGCGHHLYPRLTGNLQPHWAHVGGVARGDRPACPLGDHQRLSWHRLDALIYLGRQEGFWHRDLVRRIGEALGLDDRIIVGTIEVNKYIADDETHGRFPDLSFVTEGREIAIEVQTSPLTLHRFFERAAFYKRKGITLIWATGGFDPAAYTRTWAWDIIAGQGSVAFSFDDEVESDVRKTRRFRLRRFHSFTSRTDWKADIADLSELIFAPIPYFADLKERWITAANLHWLDAGPLMDELIERTAISVSDEERVALTQIINSLIAVERWKPVGSRATNPISVIHALLDSANGRQAAGLIRAALREFQPELLHRSKTGELLQRAEQRAQSEGLRPWGRRSNVARLREVLFPGWFLK